MKKSPIDKWLFLLTFFLMAFMLGACVPGDTNAGTPTEASAETSQEVATTEASMGELLLLR